MKRSDKEKKTVTILLILNTFGGIGAIFTAAFVLGDPLDNINMATAAFGAFTIVTGMAALFTVTRIINKFFIEGTNLTVQAASEDEKKENDEGKRKREVEAVRKASAENKHIKSVVREITEGLNNIDNLNDFFDKLLINISKPISAVQGIAYALNRQTGKFETKSTYAYYSEDTFKEFEPGEGIPGQVAKDCQTLLMDNIPQDYIKIISGLGTGNPRYLLIVPIVNNKETLAVIELATFEKPDIDIYKFSNELNSQVSGFILNNIEHK